MTHIVQVTRLASTLRYADGERANYTVRILRAADRGVACTGEYFEHERDAMRYADGAYIGLCTAGIAATRELPDDFGAVPEHA
jgi:hypothetical protein